jgi:hypothetical protein
LDPTEGYVSSEVNEKDVSVDEIIIACSDILDEDDQEFVQGCEVEEAIGYVFGKLVALGVVDPEVELRKRGLLAEE